MSRTLGKDRVVQYDVLRVVTTLLVVISHTHYHVMDTGFGGIDYSSLVDSGDISWTLVRNLTAFINTFTMPTFMALGGALFFRSMERGGFSSLGALAANKAKRLLIPFLIVGTLYSFPLKLFTGYYDQSENVLLDLIVGQLLIQGNTHLWYLPVMFLDFLICYALERYVKIPKLIKLGILACVSVLMWNFRIHLVAYPLRYMVWFYAGYCFEEKRELFDRHISFGWGLLGCLAAGAIYLGNGLLGRIPFGSILWIGSQRLLLPAVAGLSLYGLSRGIAGMKLVRGKVFKCLSRDSFGIYLYSDPVNYVVLYAASAWAGSFLFGNSLGILVLCLTRILLTLGCAILVSELLRRCKVKYIV